MSEKEKAVLVAWHKEFPALEKLGMRQADGFCKLFNKCLSADFNNEKAPQEFEPVTPTRGKLVFHKDFLIPYCAGGAA